MDLSSRLEIMNWLAGAGLSGVAETDLVRRFCERSRAAGLELSRGIVFIDTLHPVFEGRGFRWSDVESNESDLFEYESTSEGEAAENWRRSPFYTMLQTGQNELCIDSDDEHFKMTTKLVGDGHRHFATFIHRFGDAGIIGEMDCVYSLWCMRHENGFNEDALGAMRDLVPLLGLAVKSAAHARIARTIGHVYLGRDAAERVLSGRISRGVADRINAVLWFSDLRGSTAIGEAMGPAEIIPFLNDYADAAISAIHDEGGDVLKLMGDGVLAIFNEEDMAAARRAALRAENQFRKNIQVLNERRTSENRPTTSAYVGLHVGEVFYGNIGSEERLDFTVVGPAVNEVSRIASMCRSVERELLVSSAFLAGVNAPGSAHFVSTGRYALRGIGRAEELYTLDPEIRADGQAASRFEQYLQDRNR
ncbi:MAG: adenylate/guanylate cyclase domain-containing protein [Afipia sp.]|nr:adenylate/guanylate cyclase domain-containing protein [Afipia sp.]